MNSIDLIYPEKSTIRFKTMAFSDSQPHIKIDMASLSGLDKKEPVRILTRIANANDLLMALFVKNSLAYLGFEHLDLIVSYLLTARMDRVMLEGEPFSLKVISGILNQAGFRRIEIFDPHSDITTALTERSYAITNHQFVKDAMDDYFQRHKVAAFSLVSPDAGALKKIHTLARFLQIEQIVECMKERDVKTGSLTNFKTTTGDLSNQTCFIIDDICDGGGNCTGTAKLLKEKGAQKVVLIVSHGIFSRGTVLDFVDEIFTTDSFKRIEHIHCFPVEKYL